MEREFIHVIQKYTPGHRYMYFKLKYMHVSQCHSNINGSSLVISNRSMITCRTDYCDAFTNQQPTSQPNTVPSPKDSGVTPSAITYSATAAEAAKLVKTSFNKLKAKHPNILYKWCITSFKSRQNLHDLLVRSRLAKTPLVNPTVTGSDSSQDLTTLINALDEV